MTTTNNLPLPLEKMNDEDSISIISNSTSISTTETIIQDVLKNKNIFLITKNIEQRIIEILSYLQSDTNLASNKIHIVKYLQSLFMNVEFNSEIFLRKFIKEKEKMNLYKIIINQYIFYTNPGNKPEEEENYRSDLQTLFLLLLSQVTFEKDAYHYILSPLINYSTMADVDSLIFKELHCLTLKNNYFYEKKNELHFINKETLQIAKFIAEKLKDGFDFDLKEIKGEENRLNKKDEEKFNRVYLGENNTNENNANNFFLNDNN